MLLKGFSILPISADIHFLTINFWPRIRLAQQATADVPFRSPEAKAHCDPSYLWAPSRWEDVTGIPHPQVHKVSSKMSTNLSCSGKREWLYYSIIHKLRSCFLLGVKIISTNNFFLAVLFLKELNSFFSQFWNRDNSPQNMEINGPATSQLTNVPSKDPSPH